MSSTGPLVEAQVTDEYIMKQWGKDVTDHVFRKYDDEYVKTLLARKRSAIIARSNVPQRILELEDWVESEGYFNQEEMRIAAKLKQLFPAFITSRLNSMQSENETIEGKDKAYLVYIFEKYTDNKQNELCNMVDLSARHYRDLRDKYSESFDSELSNEQVYIDAVHDTHVASDRNIAALYKIMSQLKLLEVEGVDKWGDYKTINDTVDKIVQAVRVYSGKCTKNVDEWATFELFEWYITLSIEERICYGMVRQEVIT